MAEDLRRAVLDGGGALLVRQGAGSVLAFAGLLATTALIGPEAYAAGAAALGVAMVTACLGQGGIVQVLVRRSAHDVEEDGAALGILLVQGGLVVVAMLAAIPWLVPEHLAAGRPIAGALLGVVAVVILGQIPLARLERALRYRTIATTEGVCQLLGLGVGLWWAWRWRGTPLAPWAPAVGWGLQHGLAPGVWIVLGGGLPRPRWHGAGDLVRAQAAMATATATAQVRNALVTLLAGHYLGAAETGMLALAQRLVEAVSIPRLVVWRLASPLVMRVADEPARLRRLLADGTLAACAGTAATLVLFALIGLPLCQYLLGERWAGVAQAYPAFAAVSLAGALMTLPSVAVHQAGRSWEVVLSHLCLIAVVVVTGVLALPTWGVVGYAWAEVASVAVTWFIMDRCRRHWGAFAVGGAIATATTGAIATLQPCCGWWSVLPILVLMVWPGALVRLRAALTFRDAL